MHHQEIIIEKYGHIPRSCIIGTKIRGKTPFRCDAFVEFRVQMSVLYKNETEGDCRPGGEQHFRRLAAGHRFLASSWVRESTAATM